jgi:hypothetical protein
MSRTAFAVAAWLVLCSSPALAQEQRGSIQGLVKDSSGAVLPGVTVGQILKVDVALSVAGVAETVQVKGEAPLIDVKQNSAGANIQSEVIDRIPKGRDYTSVVTVAPGIDNESRNYGIQIDGSSGADNRFFIDGVDQTDLRRGTSLSINSTSKAIAADFLQQVQVKASGYSAEYRASIGGVVSAITKTGSNQWHGDMGGYFTSDKLQGTVRPTLQLNPSNQKIAEYVNAPPDAFKNWEGVFDVGGPAIHDRLWFYAGFNPQVTTTDRTVVFRSNRAAGPQTFESKPIDKILNYNVTGQIATNLRAKFTASNERVRGGLGLPNIQTDGTSTSNPTLFPSINWLDSFKDSYAGVLDWVATSHTFVNVTTSYLRYGGQTDGTYSTAIVHSFSGSNFQFTDIPSSLQNVSGYSDNPSSSRQVSDNFANLSVNTDVTRYQQWHGDHILKAGVQFERLSNNVLSGAQAPTMTFYWDASYVTVNGQRVRGKYGYYLDSRSYTQGDVVANDTSLFVQDAWTLNRKLTVNLGLRTENENVPSYRPENPGIYFGLGDKIAPRLGFAYDVKGNSKWKVYGSWGLFYDQLKFTIGRVMFGADRWVSYYNTLDTYDWKSINCAYPPVSGSNCPGTFIEMFDNRSIANDPNNNLVDPNLRPTQTEEFTLGMDHELTGTLSIGVRAVRKWADWAIESVCQFVPTGEACGVNNPGFGPIGAHPFADGPAQPPAKRVYDALEFRLRKRYANRWSLDASYLFSKLWGNWSGVASSDEAVGCLQPNSCLAFNFLYYSYDASGHVSYGVLGTDRPHQGKVQVTYDLPWGTQVGVNALASSGLPLSTIILERSNGENFFPYGRGNLGRTPTLTQVDLLVQQQVPLPGRRVKLLLGANVINLFDQMTMISQQDSPYRDAFSNSNTQFFAGFDPAAYAAANPSIRPDPRYQMANGYQARRSLMFQAKVTF